MQKVEEFFAAVKSGAAQSVAELVDADATLLGAEEGKVSAVLTAVYHRHPDIARLLVDRGARMGFFEACALGDLKAVRRMIGSDRSLLHTYSADGFAPVGFGTFFGHSDIDRFLIDEGADIHAQATNAQRVGAIHAAAAACDYSMMRLLLVRGADPNARQQMDYTALHDAAGRGDVAMATLLLAYGADRNAKTSDGKTPAAIALDRGQETFAEWLTSYEAAS
jgi:ankyrin repeat protein